MQQVGAGEAILWRAPRTPLLGPRPKRTLSRKALTASPQRRRKRSFSLARMVADGSLTHALLAGTFALLAILVLRMPFERGLRICSSFAGAAIDAAANATGFGVLQVSLSGHRATADSDIFDALELKRVRSMLDFDSRAARQRIERLPWVEKAEISRVYPDRLAVAVKERTPFAVWRDGSDTFLADASGRLLGRTPPDGYPHLPRVKGEGAAELAGGLIASIAPYADVAQRLVSAERVGSRRWTLTLANGVTLHLPADREAAALALVTSNPVLREVLGESNQIIDLRIAGRALVRPGSPAVAARAGS